MIHARTIRWRWAAPHHPFIPSLSFERVRRIVFAFKMDKEKLIEEVRKYKLLYDLSDSKYSDTIKKEEAWTEISNTLAVPVSMCKKTWSNLREAHRRAIKKQTTKSGQAAVSGKKWQYEDEMNFLLPYYKERATVSSLLRDSDQESTANEDSQLSAPDYQSDTSIIEDRPTSGSSTKTSKFPNIKRPRVLGEDGSSASSLLMKYILKEKDGKKAEDDIDKFFYSIAATVKKFNEYNRAMIKSQIFNIVSQMELREINEKGNNYYGSNNYSTAGPSGNYSTAGPSGNYSTAGPPGNYSTTVPSGNFSTTGPSGNYATPEPSGNYATPEPSGNYSTPEPSTYISTTNYDTERNARQLNPPVLSDTEKDLTNF